MLDDNRRKPVTTIPSSRQPTRDLSPQPSGYPDKARSGRNRSRSGGHGRRRLAWCEKAQAFGRTVTVKVKFADFRQVTRSRSFSAAIARHDLLRQASVELVRTILPTEKGVRLLGVTVSNFDQPPADTAGELPLFRAQTAAEHLPGAARAEAAEAGL